MPLVDSHCHIEDDSALIKRAYDAGVTAMLNAGKDLDEMRAQLDLCAKLKEQRYNGKQVPYMWTSAGVHPDSAPEKLKKIRVEDIIKAANNDFVIAIGECGLDYHYGAEYKAEQKDMFSYHVEAAGQTGLPIMIHQREAEEDMLTILREGRKKYPELKGVIHCFTSTTDFADAVLEMGFYISASGIITFKNAQDVAEVFKNYPLDKILIETDCPYLAPVPYRSKINEPAYIGHTAQKLADIREVSLQKIGDITANNFYNLYQKAYASLKEEEDKNGRSGCE